MRIELSVEITDSRLRVASAVIGRLKKTSLFKGDSRHHMNARNSPSSGSGSRPKQIAVEISGGPTILPAQPEKTPVLTGCFRISPTSVASSPIRQSDASGTSELTAASG
jgi:hypothetical protein